MLFSASRSFDLIVSGAKSERREESTGIASMRAIIPSLSSLSLILSRIPLSSESLESTFLPDITRKESPSSSLSKSDRASDTMTRGLRSSSSSEEKCVMTSLSLSVLTELAENRKVRENKGKRWGTNMQTVK